MATERTDRERDRQAEIDARIDNAIHDITDDIASWYVAERLDEPAEVCEQWVAWIHEGLSQWDRGDLQRAVALLLDRDGRTRGELILQGLRGTLYV